MNPEQTAILRQLHEEGYAICVFTPQELRGAAPHHVEDAMCPSGWEAINFWATLPAWDGDESNNPDPIG